jgi:hypothetical protein
VRDCATVNCCCATACCAVVIAARSMVHEGVAVVNVWARPVLVPCAFFATSR